jgi:DNA-binding IclR family transcriptional regulator
MARPAPSVTRVVSLINLLGEQTGEFLNLSEIARRLELNKATAHGILTALNDAGYIVRHPESGGYTLGPGLVRVGRSAMQREYEIVAIARREMEELAEATGCQCAVTGTHRDQIVVTAITGSAAEPPGTIVGQRGPRLPPYGLVFLAWAEPAEIEQWLERARLCEDEKAHYRELLDVVRERGFSIPGHVELRVRLEQTVRRLLHDVIDREVRETLVTLMAEMARESTEITEIQADGRYRARQITAPIFDPDGVVRRGLTLTGLPELTGAQVRDFGHALSAAAGRISRRLGGRRPTASDVTPLMATGV